MNWPPLNRRVKSAPAFALRTVLGLAAACAGFGPAQAEIRWTIESVTTKDGDTQVETVEIWANEKNLRMRMEDVGEPDANGPGEMIFLGEADEALMIDHREKRYMVFSAEALRAQVGEASAQLKAATAQADAAMKAALAGMDDETRALAESALKQFGGALPERGPFDQGGAAALAGVASAAANAKGPAYEVVATKEKQTILGAKARRYDLKVNGKPAGNVWAADAGAVEGGEIIRDRMKDLAAFFEKSIGEALPPALADMATASFRDSPFGHVDDIDGVPVAGVTIGLDGESVESRLVSAADADAPDGLWAPPAGYRKMDAPF